ncbi:MAG: CRTAC1 family protein, partial [Chloroflexota bacterium]
MIKKIVIALLAGLLVSCSDNESLFHVVPSRRTGIEFNNLISETDSFHVMSYEYIYNGAGVGVGDFNNDGLPDLVFAGNQVSPAAYLNEGKFRFRDISGSFKGFDSKQWFSGVAIADVNGDGLQDVYMTATRYADSSMCRNRLWINEGLNEEGLPVFCEKAEDYGIAHEGQSVNAGFFDYDRDGDLDLYVLNNTLTQRMNTQYRPKITDGTAGNNDRLFRNNGNGSFTDVTLEAGIRFEGFGLGLAFGDVNKDGYPDIYVSNDYISNDLLYINQKDGTFRNEIAKYMSYQTKSSMGNDMADINNDGFPDMYTMDMLPENYYKQRQTINGFSYQFYINDYKYGFEHQYLRNMLHVNNGLMDGDLLPFSEVGQLAGISKSEWSWSPLFADYDNDGDKDLLIANGYPRDMTDKDWTNFQAKVFGSVATAEQVIDSAPHIKVPNIAFENKGDLKFERKNDWLPEIPTYSYGAAYVDLDADGDLDYISNNIDDKAFILRNYTVEKGKDKAHYLRIKLEGEKGNTMAIGSRIELWSGGRYQLIENFLSRGYASSVDPVIHFGLAADKIVDSLKVTWPDGDKISVKTIITANSTILLKETEAVVQNESGNRQSEKLLFMKAEGIIDYTHRQADYIDFFYNQNIIPHKFSQIGPRTAQGDINGDGLEDLVIGSTNTEPTKVYLRKGNGFSEATFRGLTEKKNFSESDLAVVDVDNDGDNDVVALAGGYEVPEEQYVHCLYENRKGSFIRTVLPIPPFPASVLRKCDYDHDGDVDFFIGSRVKKDMFPYANHSWILKNDKGKFYTDAECRIDLGMVTDAVWVDYDNDGWEDLI